MVKICGLARREDALAAERLGARYLGMVLTEGFARSVAPERAAAMLQGTTAERVAVLVDEAPARAAALAGTIGASVVQLHGHESPEMVGILRTLGDWRIWKAVRVRAEEDIAGAVLEYGELVDGILLEGWKDGVVGGGGATLSAGASVGRRHLPDSLDFVLAGGLTPETVRDAVLAFRPDVLDVSSGVESSLREKDEDRMRRFVEAVAGAAASC